MTLFRTVDPAVEPVTLAEIKAQLRSAHDSEDELLGGLIRAARDEVERATSSALIAQNWRLVLDEWPESRAIRLPVSPMISLTEIRCYDGEGGEHQIAIEQFLPDGQAVPARLICPGTVAGAPVLRGRMGIEIDYVAGFGDVPEDVPADLIQSLKTLVAYWYENRDSVLVSGAGAAVPAGFERLVSAYRRVRL